MYAIPKSCIVIQGRKPKSVTYSSEEGSPEFVNKKQKQNEAKEGTNNNKKQNNPPVSFSLLHFHVTVKHFSAGNP